MSTIPSKNDLLKSVGSMSQVAGLKHYRLVGGLADGVEGIDVRTGAGLSYTILAGRGMDIAWADFRGSAISYMSKTGIVAPSFHDPRGMEWLRGFSAGLLTTCGLSNVGRPCEETDPVIGNRPYGLHGRISNTPADCVSLFSDWTDDGRYVMRVRGVMHEATVHCENLVLRRQISSELGRNAIEIEDEIENAGFEETPLMVLYHVNLGYPLLSPDSVLASTAARVTPGTPEATAEPEEYGRFGKPSHGYPERLYFHELRCGGDGRALVGLLNERIGYGISVSFPIDELTELTEWKVLRETEYVLGIEPGNTRPIGRDSARASKKLVMMKPGEKRRFTLSLEVLDGIEAIRLFREKTLAVMRS